MRLSHRLATLPGLAALLIATLACNLIGDGTGGVDVEDAVNATLTALAPTALPDSALPTATIETIPPTVDPLAACPQPAADQQQIVSQDNGFCFVYPALFVPSPDRTTTSRSIALAGPPLDPTAIETISVFMTVTYTGPAYDVTTTADYANKWDTLYVTADMRSFVTRTDITVGGQPAVLFSNLPGMIGSQAALILVGGHKYKIEMYPQPADVPELADQANALWNAVTQSIVFFTPASIPAITEPGVVCPQAAADTKLHVSESEGFCFLVPADAEQSDLFFSGYEVGPFLSHPDFPDLRTRIVLGTRGPANGATNPRDTAPGLLEEGAVDPATVHDLTIGGQPALEYVSINGPFRQRGALIIYNDTVYTISLNPYDQGMYPETFALAEALWPTVTNSLQFFTPWN